MALAGGGIAGLILLVACAAYSIQQNTFLHRYLLAKMIQMGEKSSGAQIAIRDFSIRWIPLHITLEGAIVRGGEKNVSAPLANLPRIEIGVRWAELLHKQVVLTELTLDRPAINLVTDEAGRSNLPGRPVSSSGPSTNRLQVSIERAAVRNGELRYNNSPRKIDADLADFHLEVSHSTGT